MKYFISTLSIVICFFSISQEKYRIVKKDSEKVIKISDQVYSAIVMVESRLNSNEKHIDNNDLDKVYNPNVSLISQSYKNNKLSAKQVQAIENIICYKCYEEEWALQFKTSNRLKEYKDSVKVAVKQQYDDSLRQDKELAEQSKPALTKSEVETPTKPYDLLKRSLYAHSYENHDLVVFRGMDWYFSDSYFSSYLQLKMRLGLKDTKFNSTEIVSNYIPKASSKSEFVNVTYKVVNHSDIIGYMDLESVPVPIIQTVIIEGTPSYLIDMFLNYWPGKVTIGGYKVGEIASKTLLGDHIVLEGVSPSKYRIKIIKGNITVDYEKMYGINSKK